MIAMLAKTLVSDKLKSPTVKRVALGLGVVTILGAGTLIVSKKLKKKQRERVKDKLFESVEITTEQAKRDPEAASKAKGVTIAQVFRSAIKGAGTNEDMIFQSLKDLKDEGVKFLYVQKAYKELYKNRLLEDLNKELSANEYREFKRLLQQPAISAKDVELAANIDKHWYNPVSWFY